MANSDPKIVVDAILAEGNDDKIGVYPVTIRRYALLERIESPFVKTDLPFTVDNVIPTTFVMCQKPEELKRWCNATTVEIREAAFEWSENLPLDDIPKMIAAITDQFLKIQKAAPDSVQKNDVKKNPTEGQ